MTQMTYEEDKALAEKFNWWWRGLFVKESEGKYSPAPESLNLSMVFAPPAKVYAPKDIGKTFRGMYRTYEVSAFLYELSKRVAGKYEFKRPWIELAEKERRALEDRWPDPLGDQASRISSHDDLPRPGWSDFDNLSWNLNQNNNTLVKSFLRHIEEQRVDLEMPNPSANAGRRNRARSWRPIELLDMSEHRIRTLNESETTQVSKARAFLQKSLSGGTLA